MYITCSYCFLSRFGDDEKTEVRKMPHIRVMVEYRGLVNILQVRVVQHILEAERMGVDGLLL